MNTVNAVPSTNVIAAICIINQVYFFSTLDAIPCNDIFHNDTEILEVPASNFFGKKNRGIVKKFRNRYAP